MDQRAAFKTAFLVLGGQIGECIAFRSIDASRAMIAAVKTGDYGTKEVHLLKKFGLTFRTVWSITKIMNLDAFSVEDIDGDGNKEIVFTESSSGTGAGYATLSVYSHSRKQIVHLTQQWEWSDATRPDVPQIDIEAKPPRDNDKKFIEAVEKYAIASGFLKQTEIDLDDPNCRAARWHLDNGNLTWGAIKLRLYPGPPPCNSSISQQLSAGGVEWIAFFKGSLFGYLKDKDEHFIAYSPASTYNWVIALISCAGAVWFVRNNELQPRLYKFILDGKQGRLESYPIPGNPILLQTLECRPDGILVNSNIPMLFSSRLLKNDFWPRKCRATVGLAAHHSANSLSTSTFSTPC